MDVGKIEESGCERGIYGRPAKAAVLVSRGCVEGGVAIALARQAAFHQLPVRIKAQRKSHHDCLT